MANIDFGLYITRRVLPASETFKYNQDYIHALPSGFTALWMEDHLQWGEIPVLECFTTLSFLAAAFPNFQIGALVMSQSYRNPALVAKMAATIQHLSRGRLILGIGVGWKEDEYLAYGYSFPKLKTRLEQLEEAILVMQSLWTSRPATFTGQYYRIQDAYCEPQPSPPIPLLIGGGGERETLRLVARYADWWNFNAGTVEEYAHKVAILQKHCNDIGRAIGEIKLTYSAWINLAEDRGSIMRDPQKHIIAGNPTEIIEELNRFCELGVTHFMLKFPNLQTLELFGSKVMPSFL